MGLLRQSQGKHHNINEVQQLFHNRGYTLLSNEYKNNRTYLFYICNKHLDKGPLKITLRDFLSGKGCKYCGFQKSADAKKKPTELYIQLCNEMNFEYVGRYVDPKTETSVIQYICKKHPQAGIQCKSARNLEQRIGCPICSTLKNEKLISDILNRWGYKFEQQKRFPDCRDKNPLPFDFYLPDFNVLIEYDGEYHYKSIPRKSNDNDADYRLESTQRHDNIKTNYCKQNNLYLIRIPYWKQNDIEYILFDELVKAGAIQEI